MATIDENRGYEPSNRARRDVNNQPAWMNERRDDRYQDRESSPGQRRRYDDDRRPRGRNVDNRPAWMSQDADRPHRRSDDSDRDSRPPRREYTDRSRDAYGRGRPGNDAYGRDSSGSGSYMEARLIERLKKPIPNVWARSPPRERDVSDSDSASDASSGYSSYDSSDSYDSRKYSRRRRSSSRTRGSRRRRSRSRSVSRSPSRSRSRSVSSVSTSSSSSSYASRRSRRRSSSTGRHDRSGNSNRRSRYSRRSRSRSVDRSSRSRRRGASRARDRDRSRSRDRSGDKRRYRERRRDKGRDRDRHRDDQEQEHSHAKAVLPGPTQPKEHPRESHGHSHTLPGPTVPSPSPPKDRMSSAPTTEEDEIAAYKRNVLGIDPETNLPIAKEGVKEGESGNVESDDEYGPRMPGEEERDEHGNVIPHGSIPVSYGKHLLRGEGEAMAAYVQAGKRVPRRGEVSWSSEQIEKLESQGYVMSGSRHKRMNEVRIRKENQVFTAEEKRALSLLKAEERQDRERQLMEEFRSLVDERKKNM